MLFNIYARGETQNRGNTIDLMLMDTMLRPVPDLPDLALLMVQHWLRLQKSTTTGGKIKIGGYVEIIKGWCSLNVFPGRDLISGPSSLDAESYRLAHFVFIWHGSAGYRDHYDWRFADGFFRWLPFAAPISFDDHSTWLVTAAAGPTPPPNATPPRATDIPSSSSQPAPTEPTSHHPADPTLRDIYFLMSDMRDTQLQQGLHILDIQRQTALHTTR